MANAKFRDALSALAISIAAILALCWVFNPRWETNDDVGMSMVAHGYGLVAIGSPNLIFSNVIWGYFVRAIPQINGVLGYSIATMGVLSIFGAVLLHTLRRLGYGWVFSLGVLALVLARPVLFPQFTINSGLLTVGAVLCWQLYNRGNRKETLVLGCVLAFAGYLLRSQEFFLVLFVALPLLPWRKLVRSRTCKIAAFCLLVAIGGAKFVDYRAYQGDEWISFTSINAARAPYTDFGADSMLLARADVYEKYGYSRNDVHLVTGWGVYADPNLADPDKLVTMLSEIGFIHKNDVLLKNIIEAFRALLDPAIIAILLLAAPFLAFGLNVRSILVLFLFMTSLIFMGILGRPGIIRVYYPLVVIIILSPILLRNIQTFYLTKFRKIICFACLFLVLLANSYVVGSQSFAATKNTAAVTSQMADFPKKSVIVWGAEFPYEALYPVLRIPAASLSYRLHGLGVFSPAPFSVAFRENSEGSGIANQFAAADGMFIVADDNSTQILSGYCEERLKGKMSTLSSQRHGPILLRVIRCEAQ